MQLNFSEIHGGKVFNDQFGTVRLWEAERFIVGNDFEILVRNQSMGYAKVVAERVFDYSQIRDVLAFLETGKSTYYLAAILLNIYGGKEKQLPGDTKFVHVVLQYTNRNIDNQSILIKDWWQKKVAAQPNPLQHNETVFP